jgi:hypothetical protein
MKRSRAKPLRGAFLFMAVFALFGAPSAPMVGLIPTVGGDALACGDTYMNAGGNPSNDMDCDGTPDNVDPCPNDPSNMCKDDGRSRSAIQR